LKSDIVEGRHYIECTCGSYDHLLVFEIDPDFYEEWGAASVSFTSGYHEKFFGRLKAAIRYIFKKEKYLRISDSIIINQKNINSLKEAIEEIEELAKTKKLI
jgi:hypothetical protein